MPELLKNVDSAHLAVIVGGVWLLREIFGFLNKFTASFLRRQESKPIANYLTQTDVQMQLIQSALQSVAENIKAQTEILYSLAREIDKVVGRLEALETQIKDLRSDTRKAPRSFSDS